MAFREDRKAKFPLFTIPTCQEGAHENPQSSGGSLASLVPLGGVSPTALGGDGSFCFPPGKGFGSSICRFLEHGGLCVGLGSVLGMGLSPSLPPLCVKGLWCSSGRGPGAARTWLGMVPAPGEFPALPAQPPDGKRPCRPLAQSLVPWEPREGCAWSCPDLGVGSKEFCVHRTNFSWRASLGVTPCVISATALYLKS